ncbi:prepilin-type N-terminal cleavage/methylation domain-containing protein [bacterium]|nr:prepilin-type N-terminal cleavage/methylation domain-containing protein [bacterium]MBU1983658.1 prepilin-type N-terminal cleavage/methylation domain-containing protein [bacterium]
MRRRRPRGFTLYELLIAVVIVGILAGLAIVRYMNLQDKSRQAAATYDLDLVRKLLAIYATDYGGYPVAVASYDDLKSQLVGPDGLSYGRCPPSNTFQWASYQLDASQNYVLRVNIVDRQHTVLIATPDRIYRE